MRLALALSLTFALTAPVQAGSCQGQNLIAALPPAELAALQAKADGPYDHGNFWQARKDGQLITLVGTYHMTDPRFDATLATLQPRKRHFGAGAIVCAAITPSSTPLPESKQS